VEQTKSPAVEPGLAREVSNTLKGCGGNLVEWYDVYVYAAFAKHLESQLIASDEAHSGIWVWAVFGVTFVMRPVGSWFFGRRADRLGRREALTLSVLLMAACSLFIAAIPPCSAIGAAATWLLVAARLGQGFATGGEYGTSATYMSEAAGSRRRGLLSSLHYVTLVGGQVLAQTVLLLTLTWLQPQQVTAWGWRLAFALGGLAAVAVLWARRTMDETLTVGGRLAGPSLTHDVVRADVKSPAGLAGGGLTPRTSSRADGRMAELLRWWRGELLAVFLITAGGTVCFHVYSVNAPAQVAQVLGASAPRAAAAVNAAALAVLMLLQPVGGWLADRFGRKALLVFFGLGALAYTWVLVVELPGQTSPVGAFAMMVTGFVILTGYTSVSAVAKAQLFPIHVRALGVGFGYALANSTLGGTAPLLYQAAAAEGRSAVFAIYATGVVAVSLTAYVLLVPGRRQPNWLDTPDAMAKSRNR
jgi:MHS family alpha-ketoglutarate permease-like MFS transporter